MSDRYIRIMTYSRFVPVTVANETIFTLGPGLDGHRNYVLYAFAPDGSVRWSRRVGTPQPTPLPVANGNLYLFSGEKGVKTLDTTTGNVVWEKLPRVAVSDIPLAADGTLFVTEETSPGVILIALDAVTGDEYWRTA
jgi:outer membrane protein assembly factor BamB